MDSVGNRTVPQILREQADFHRDRLAIVHEDLEGRISELTYAQLAGESFAIAAGLVAAGLKKGDRVFVFLRNTPEFIPVWFAVMCAGGIVVPGNIFFTEPEVSYLLETAAPAFIVTEAQFIEIVGKSAAAAACTAKIIATDNAPGATPLSEIKSVSSFTAPALSSDDVAQIIFTSGTSSRPKGVMLTHANLIWCGMSGGAAGSLRSDDRSFNNKPLFHANCQETVLACLMSGATAVIGERYSASRYMQQLVKHKATICSLSGMLCRTLLNQPPSPYDRQHTIRYAGYGINISRAEMDGFVERFGIRIRNGYGQSEAMLYISWESIGTASTYPSIGRPPIGREVFIIDEVGEILPPGRTGEIVVRGRRGRDLMLGYYRDEAATAEVFQGGWLHTGDIGSFDVAGNLFFHGRKKEIIKRAGENISVIEVEEALVEHPYVIDVAVIGIPDKIRDQAVKAFVVLQPDRTVTPAELQEFCAKRLAYFKLPTFFEFVTELPRNASGKLLRRELETRAAQDANGR